MSKVWAMFAVVLPIVSGCGRQDGRAKNAGQAVGETLTDFAQGVGSGIDKKLEAEVELSEKVAALGLSKTVAKNLGINDHKKAIAVYIMSQQAATVTLIAKALNVEEQEIGRSVVDVDFAADDAKYVTFRFDAEMDSQLVRRYVIDVRPTNDERPPSSAEDVAEKQS